MTPDWVIALQARYPRNPATVRASARRRQRRLYNRRRAKQVCPKCGVKTQKFVYCLHHRTLHAEMDRRRRALEN
jgi:hypothetical protein